MKKVQSRRDREDVARHKVTFAILRAIKGLSPSEVAAKSGVSAQTIQNLRKPVQQGGTMFPHLHTVVRIAKAFGLELQVVERSTGVWPYATSSDARSSVTLS